MKEEDITKEYKYFLNGLEFEDLNIFLKEFKSLESYKEKEEYLNKKANKQILNILGKKEYLDLFYLDSQAKYILEELYLNDLDILKTLVYCYNTNSREFNDNIKEQELKEKLFKDGYKEIKPIKWDLKNETKEEFNKRREEKYKKFDGLKVVCVLDRDRTGIMGSFTRTEEHKGKLIYNDNRLFFLPKGNRTRGQIITNRIYYKEVLK